MHRLGLTFWLCRFSFLPRASVNRTTSINMRRQTPTTWLDPLTVICISHSPEKMRETLTGESMLPKHVLYIMLIRPAATGSTISLKTMTVSFAHHGTLGPILILGQPVALQEARATIATTENLQEMRTYHALQTARSPNLIKSTAPALPASAWKTSTTISRNQT